MDLSQKKILIICLTDLERDPRVNRQIRFLNERYSVMAAGLADPKVDGVDFIPLQAKPKPLPGRAVGALKLLARMYESYYWMRSDVRICIDRLRSVECDLVLANDIDTLPLALKIAGRAAVWFDAHEYAPREFEEHLHFRVLHQGYRRHLCNTYIPRVDSMMTVCDSIAHTYQADTGVRPQVVWNGADYEELEPQPTGGGATKIRLVHHGGAQRSRGLETMIRMMRYLDDRFELNLVLVGNDKDYMSSLRSEAGGDERIKFLEPVPMRQLPGFLNRFDIGVYILRPTNFNNRHALPNKFFEFVQARLAIGIGPSPEMARLVREHDLGVVAADFEPQSLAKMLQPLDAESIDRYKRNSANKARLMSADTTRRKLQDTAAQLLRERC